VLLSLLLSMFTRHQRTLQTPVELYEWKIVIAIRRNHDPITQLYRPVSILKQSVELRRSTSSLQSTSPPPATTCYCVVYSYHAQLSKKSTEETPSTGSGLIYVLDIAVGPTTSAASTPTFSQLRLAKNLLQSTQGWLITLKGRHLRPE
jgi:hypothetical protein